MVKNETVCRFFLRGECREGTQCHYSHCTSPGGPEVPNDRADIASATMALPDTRALVPCKYHLLGRCSRGEECAFAHPEVADAGLGQPQPDDAGVDNEHDDFTRELSGAFARFEDGGCLSKIVLAWDFVAVRLNGLPQTACRKSVSALLQHLGLDVPERYVRLWRESGTKESNATIQVEDATLAKEFCVSLKAESNSNQEHSGLRACQMPSSAPSWSATRRVNCNKVNVSWHRFTRPVWLNFGNGDIARRVSDKFNNGTYVVHSQPIKAEQAVRSPSRGRHNPVAWTVLLKDVPVEASEDNIKGAVRAFSEKPRNVELSHRNAACDPKMVPASVRSLLEGVGTVEFDIRGQLQGKRIKAVARFAEEHDAREAVQSFHNKPQAFLNQGGQRTNKPNIGY